MKQTTHLLGLDFESQCDQAKTTRITEVGCVLIRLDRDPNDWRLHKWVEEARISTLCYEPDYPPQTEFIVKLTGITDEMLKDKGVRRARALANVITLMNQADVIVAHKTLFDKTVLEHTAYAVGLEVPQKEWLCSLSNFPWRENLPCRKLSHLAYEHDVIHKREELHRAVEDVHLMFRVMSKYDIDEVLAYARDPWVYVEGFPLAPWLDGKVQNKLAKQHGFSWEAVKYGPEEQFPKKWVKRVKRKEFEKEREVLLKLPFRVAEIKGIN